MPIFEITRKEISSETTLIEAETKEEALNIAHECDHIHFTPNQDYNSTDKAKKIKHSPVGRIVHTRTSYFNFK
jgi:hypothetical protein